MIPTNTKKLVDEPDDYDGLVNPTSTLFGPYGMHRLNRVPSINDVLPRIPQRTISRLSELLPITGNR